MKLRFKMPSVNITLPSKSKFFGKATYHKAVFIDKSSSMPPISERFNVILTPSFYWCKIEKLPVKFEFQAKELAPSLFDTTLPHGNYNYMAVKLSTNERSLKEAEPLGANEFYYALFAYDEKVIKHKFSELGLFAGVQNIFFAQTELKNLDGAVKIDDKVSLTSFDGIVSLVPTQFTETKLYAKELRLQPSGYAIKLSSFDSEFIDKRYFAAAIVILSLFASMFLGEYYLVKKEIVKLEETKEQVNKTYQLPATSLQIKALLEELRGEEGEQLKLRDNILYLSTTPLEKGEYYTKIELEKNTLKVGVKLNSQPRSDAVLEFLKKRFKLGNSTFTNSTLNADIKL